MNITLALGILVSLYLLYEVLTPGNTITCTISEQFDCQAASNSVYAHLDGFLYFLAIDLGLGVEPVEWNVNLFMNIVTSNAFLGFAMLSLLMIMIWFHQRGKQFFSITPQQIPKWLLGISIWNMAYGAYLIGIQHFILRKYCPFCLLLDGTLFLMLILSIVAVRQNPRTNQDA